LTADGEELSRFSKDAFIHDVLLDLKNAFLDKKSFTKKYTINQQTIHTFIELIQPSISILILLLALIARSV